jgi:hypothetical protein
MIQGYRQRHEPSRLSATRAQPPAATQSHAACCRTGQADDPEVAAQAAALPGLMRAPVAGGQQWETHQRIATMGAAHKRPAGEPTTVNSIGQQCGSAGPCCQIISGGNLWGKMALAWACVG